MTNRSHEKLKSEALKKPGVKKAYDALKEEFDLLEMMINARLKAGKTQSEVAKEMNTTTSVIGRLETGGGKLKHSPTIETLRGYARAVNCRLEVKFIHAHKLKTLHKHVK